jgi:hypothetical protein
MTRIGSTDRATLALVQSPAPAGSDLVCFCGHCGVHADAPTSTSRVCTGCGLGVMLTADASLAPAPGAPFVIVDCSLSVCAVSRGAEQLLGVTETAAVNRHVTELFVPAEAEAEDPANLAVAIAWAARGEEPGHRHATIRPANVFGVRMPARIGRCGPPTAALVLFT